MEFCSTVYATSKFTLFQCKFPHFNEIFEYVLQAGDMYEKIRDTAQAMSCFKKGKAYRRGQSYLLQSLDNSRIHIISFLITP